jgi:hypothetical protein
MGNCVCIKHEKENEVFTRKHIENREKTNENELIICDFMQTPLMNKEMPPMVVSHTNSTIGSANGESQNQNMQITQNLQNNPNNKININQIIMRAKDCQQKLISIQESNDQEYEFDYFQHSRAIFEIFNSFREKPSKFIKKLQKFSMIDETDAMEAFNKIHELKIENEDTLVVQNESFNSNYTASVLWSEKIYNYIYKHFEEFSFNNSNKNDDDFTNKNKSKCLEITDDRICTKSRSYVFYVDGNHDPEKTFLLILGKYLKDLDIFLLNKIDTAAVCSFFEKVDQNILLLNITFS